MHHLKKLNLELPGKLKTLSDLVQKLSRVNKLRLYHPAKEELTHFPSLLKASGEAVWVSKGSTACHATLVENLQQTDLKTDSAT